MSERTLARVALGIALLVTVALATACAKQNSRPRVCAPVIGVNHAWEEATVYVVNGSFRRKLLWLPSGRREDAVIYPHDLRADGFLTLGARWIAAPEREAFMVFPSIPVRCGETVVRVDLVNMKAASSVWPERVRVYEARVRRDTSSRFPE